MCANNCNVEELKVEFLMLFNKCPFKLVDGKILVKGEEKDFREWLGELEITKLRYEYA